MSKLSSDPTPYPVCLSSALALVKSLREQQALNPALQALVLAVKRVQCARFRSSYVDVLTHPDWRDAARFFLRELYGDQDF